MSTATSSVTTSDPSWSTPTTQAMAQAWQTPEQYQQYYNYYQSMSQTPVATTTMATPAVAATATPVDPAAAPYIQDYSKAWEEYYKAYYGQSYTVSAPPTQYPASAYNYDQYGYPNIAAPPPVYQYDTSATAGASQYSQPQPAAPTGTASYPYTDPSYAAPPAAPPSWNAAPPPTYEQPIQYGQSHAYQQPGSFDKPPPSFEQGGSYPTGPGTSFGADSGNKDASRSSNRGRGYNKEDVRSLMDIKDDFRPPPRNNRFEQNSKPVTRPGSFNERVPYENDDRSSFSNRNTAPQSSQYNNNYDQRHQYNDNTFNDEKGAFRGRGESSYVEESGFKDHSGQSSFGGRGGAANFGASRDSDGSYGGRDEESGFGGRGGDSSYRGNRGSDVSYGGRGGDSSYGNASYGGRGGGDSNYGNRGGENAYRGRGGADGSYNNRGGDSSYSGRGNETTYGSGVGRGSETSYGGRGGGDTGYRGGDAYRGGQEDHGFANRGGRGGDREAYRGGRGGEGFRGGRGGDAGSFRGAPRGRGSFDNANAAGGNRRYSGEDHDYNASGQRWGGREDVKADNNQRHPWEGAASGNEDDNMSKGKRESPWATEDSPEDRGWKRKAEPMINTDAVKKMAPQALMDLVVRPSAQSPVVVRRQALIDQWQTTVAKDHAAGKLASWQGLKGALVPEVQGLLAPSFIRSGAGDSAIVYCELHLDDIFLVQAKGANDDLAIEEASKAMWQLLLHRLHVHTASRSSGSEKVPVFAVSRSQAGPVSVPPFIKVSGTESSPVAAGCKVDTAMAEVVTSKPVVANKPVINPSPATTTTAPAPAAAMATGYKDDDIFLVVDASAPQEKDQSISILNNTAKFNKISIEYKHEKPPNAPHISQCLITINGQEFEKSEARDYLFAKREAAEKAVHIFKESCPQISVNYERAREVSREDLTGAGAGAGGAGPSKTVDESIGEMLKQLAASEADDDMLKFSQAFSSEERDAVAKAAGNVNLSVRSEGKVALLVWKQYPLEEMKKRILRHGFCAQYRLVVNGTASFSNGNNNAKSE